MTAKKPAQLHSRRDQAASGSCNWAPMMERIRLRLNTSWPADRTSANSQYSTVGFHLMKVSSCRNSVAPPNTTMMARLTQSMVSTFLPRSLSQPTWAKVAAMATPVAT